MAESWAMTQSSRDSCLMPVVRVPRAQSSDGARTRSLPGGLPDGPLHISILCRRVCGYAFADLGQRSIPAAGKSSRICRHARGERNDSDSRPGTNPAETNTDLQVICLFRSDPSNTLDGSLAKIDEKLQGLFERIRKPNLFAGELGETLLLTPPGRLAARRLLIIGLGDSETFIPARMEFVGAVTYREALRLGASQPYFAPTILDGGVTKFSTGEIAEHFISGFQRAARTDAILRDAGDGERGAIESLTYLAGAEHAASTLDGIKKTIRPTTGARE
jgi:cytosol aminopeptidase family protein